MKRTALCIVAIAFLCAFQAAPAQAQNRVFVAAQGSDANPCTFALPCRTFQHAHDVVAANGEIDVLDPAGYGALNITKAISIQGHGFSGISAASGNAITITAGESDRISLRGLLIDGVTSGGSGINFNTGGVLDVQDCLIRHFSSHGILFQPNSGSSLFVSNSHIADNTLNGILVTGAFPNGVIDHVVITTNGSHGLYFFADHNLSFMVSDSVVSYNAYHGVSVATGGASVEVLLRNVAVFHNAVDGVLADGSTATVRITKSTVIGNFKGLETLNAGKIVSFGDNSVDGNFNSNGTPTSTIPLK